MFSKATTYALRAVLYLAVEGNKKNKLGVTSILLIRLYKKSI